MLSLNFRAVVVVLLLAGWVDAFCPSGETANTVMVHRRNTVTLKSTRRAFVDNAVQAASLVTLFGLTTATPKPALASGGATAGGAYLLSAKQRYNERVVDGVKGYVALGAALESGDLNVVKAFFSEEEKGSWKDFSAAGYLLANAFRRNSTAAPDSLPSVKKWKAFAAKVQAMTAALKKKDKTGISTAYNDSLEALDAYLAQVELPTAKEIASS